MVSPPREIEPRISWFLSNKPNGTGMCAQHTWHSLGGDYGNPPAWGADDANACVDKVKSSGRYWTPQTWSGPPPRGAWVGWKYGNNGHAALSNGDGKITTTDPSNGKPTGTESLDYPKRWGFNTSNGPYTVWTDQYNGVRFPVGTSTISHGDIYLSKLKYGQDDSDSVKRLQMHLNSHSLAAPGNVALPLTGGYFDQTDTVVRADQTQHGLTWEQSVADPEGKSSVGPKQAAHLISSSCGCAVIDDTPPPDSGSSGNDVGQVWDYYSGKPGGTLTVQASADYIVVDATVKAAPADGLEFHMVYANIDLTWSSGSTKDGTIRVKYVRDGGDATGYQDYCVSNGKGDFLLTATHWEAGQKGVGGKWYINLGGGISKGIVGTRYVKAGGVCY